MRYFVYLWNCICVYILIQRKRNFMTTAQLWEQKTIPYTIQSGCKQNFMFVYKIDSSIWDI